MPLSNRRAGDHRRERRELPLERLVRRFLRRLDVSASLISTSGSPRSSRSRAAGKRFVRISPSLAFDVFPQVTHRTCGGEPSRSTSKRKSSSLLMTTTPASRAALKMKRSFASRSPKSRTACASIRNVSLSHRTRATGSCASIQKITLPLRDDRVADWRTGGMQQYPRAQDPVVLPAPAPASVRLRAGPAHR